MHKITYAFLLVFFTTAINYRSYSQRADKAEAFIENINKSNFSILKNYYFADNIKHSVDSASLMGMWKSLEMTHGPFLSVSNIRVAKEKSVVILLCNFTVSVLTWQISFDSNNLINGFHILSVKKLELYQLPSYADKNSFTEIPVYFEGHFGALKGMLTIPKKRSALSLVIFVHGSGPHDLDESIGPNKPFKDLAYGLATNGVASFRYDKSTFVYKKNVQTVKDEVIDDCVRAIQFCKKIDTLSFERIFILGHSLGAYISPRIAYDHIKVDGLILLSTIFKSFPAIVQDQLNYINTLPDSLRPANAEISFLKNEIRKTDNLNSIEDSVKILGLPKSYWRDLENYHVKKTMRKLRIPVLFLQGARDYQVDVQNFNEWKKRFGNKKNVNLILYPGLNHFFFEGEGPSFPGEYNKPGHVYEKVIKDICRWTLSI